MRPKLGHQALYIFRQGLTQKTTTNNSDISSYFKTKGCLNEQCYFLKSTRCFILNKHYYNVCTFVYSDNTVRLWRLNNRLDMLVNVTWHVFLFLEVLFYIVLRFLIRLFATLRAFLASWYRLTHILSWLIILILTLQKQPYTLFVVYWIYINIAYFEMVS